MMIKFLAEKTRILTFTIVSVFCCAGRVIAYDTIMIHNMSGVEIKNFSIFIGNETFQNSGISFLGKIESVAASQRKFIHHCNLLKHHDGDKSITESKSQPKFLKNNSKNKYIKFGFILGSENKVMMMTESFELEGNLETVYIKNNGSAACHYRVLNNAMRTLNVKYTPITSQASVLRN